MIMILVVTTLYYKFGICYLQFFKFKEFFSRVFFIGLAMSDITRLFLLTTLSYKRESKYVYAFEIF